MKVNGISYCRFEALVEGEMFKEIKHFQSKNDAIPQSSDLTDWYERNVKEQVIIMVEEFEQEKSSLSLTEIIKMSPS